ncbi:hypothetical protein KC19_12G013900 [Ceratodon purpureus]|uniref:Secreted protein n=1 Tax=Ceratodon purpureus TaxID=3225 RepID=A0A8T0G6F8_CERPU|nr:hypothetical protein KC19_12G013900 [Ceratodon purpureus]
MRTPTPLLIIFSIGKLGLQAVLFSATSPHGVLSHRHGPTGPSRRLHLLASPEWIVKEHKIIKTSTCRAKEALAVTWLA